ncbi:MAG: transposase [Acidimicrobiales bacterium]
MSPRWFGDWKATTELLGHRGRKQDPLYRIRKLLLSGSERLDERGSSRMLLGLRLGDPDTDDPPTAAVLLDKAIAGCLADDVPEIQSLGNTLKRWRSEILAHHETGASNGPTEGLNLCVKKVKRAGHGFASFDHYRLRVLLHAGGVTWPSRPKPPRIRSRSPHSDA